MFAIHRDIQECAATLSQNSLQVQNESKTPIWLVYFDQWNGEVRVIPNGDCYFAIGCVSGTFEGLGTEARAWMVQKGISFDVPVRYMLP